VRLLFDANLSPTLVAHLRSHYPGSRHVRDIGLATGSDAEIRAFAKAQNDVIVSNDSDFRERSFVEGFPPKVVWLSFGNAGTVEIADRLRQDHTASAIRGRRRGITADHFGRRADGLTARCTRRPR
jgi:predicted nuclease of predicted toxin-antitoxin system